MSWLRKLNPANSLFGRIFLWFWFAMFIVASCSIWLSRQLSSEYKLRPINPSAVKKLENMANRLERATSRFPNLGVNPILKRVAQRNKNELILISMTSEQWLSSMPRIHQKLISNLFELREQTNTYKIKTMAGEFHGPLQVNIRDEYYALFWGKPRVPNLANQIRNTPPVLLIVAAILISTLLCALLAWSLIKPIRKLQSASQLMASGDLSARAESVQERGDELGQLGRDFNRMSQQVEDSLKRQKRLLTDISHELRSPLARLQVAIGIAEQQTDSPNQALQRIETEAHKIETMLQQILHLSRLQDQQQLPESKPIALQALLTKLCENADFEAKAQSKSVRLTCEQPLQVIGDAQLLSSAFENVIRNAVKYAKQTVEVTLNHEQNQAVISVEDDGTGIAETELEQIFLPFYRASSSRTRDSGGIGLGLSIAQRAILAHQGNMSASNIQSGGLKVLISLPTKTNT